jgi:hypothetical protein
MKPLKHCSIRRYRQSLIFRRQDFSHLHHELSRLGVTRRRLREECRAQQPVGLQDSARLGVRYRVWLHTKLPENLRAHDGLNSRKIFWLLVIAYHRPDPIHIRIDSSCFVPITLPHQTTHQLRSPTTHFARSD